MHMPVISGFRRLRQDCDIETIKKKKGIFKRVVTNLVLYIKWDLGKKQYRLHQRCSSNAHCDYDDPVEVHIQLQCSGDENLFLTDVQYLTSILMQRPTLKNLASYLNQSHLEIFSLNHVRLVISYIVSHWNAVWWGPCGCVQSAQLCGSWAAVSQIFPNIPGTDDFSQVHL